MARGEVQWFAQAIADVGAKLHDLASDDQRLAFVTGAAAPDPLTPGPTWGSAGAIDMSAHEVATGGAEYAGPIALTSVTWARDGDTVALDAANIELAEDPAGFEDARWGIIFNDSDPDRRCLAYVDLGAERSLREGEMTIEWHADGILLAIRRDA